MASVLVTGGAPTVALGATAQFSAVVRDAAGRTLERSVTWSSSDTAVASVSATGLVTGRLAGRTARIVATSEGREGSMPVEIRLPPTGAQEVATPVSVALPSGVALTQESLRLSAGVHAAALPAAGGGTANLGMNRTQLVTAATPAGDPVLFAITASAGSPVAVSGRSTAEALVFLNAALASSAVDTGATILAAIRASARLDALQQRLETRLRANPSTALTQFDQAVADAIEAVVDDVLARVPSPRGRLAAVARAMGPSALLPSGPRLGVLQTIPGGAPVLGGLSPLLPTGPTSQGGVQLQPLAADASGRPRVRVTNAGARWVSVVTGYSQDGQVFTTPSDENGPIALPRTMLKPFRVSVFGASSGSSDLTLSATAAFARVKVFGLGRQSVAAAFGDPDIAYAISPAIHTVILDLALPVLQVALGLTELAPTVETEGAWARWFSSTGGCAVSNAGSVALLLETYQGALENNVFVPLLSALGKCAVSEFAQAEVAIPILTRAVGASAAAILLRSVFTPLKVVLLVYGIAKNAVNFAITVNDVAAFSPLSTFALAAPPQAVRLRFLATPSAVALGQPISPALQVAIESATGDRVTTSTAPVTIAIATGPGGAVLSGTLSRSAVSGVATFPDLRLDRAGSYTLTATSGTLTSAVSATFTVQSLPPAISGLSVTPTTLSLSTGATSPIASSVQQPAGAPAAVVSYATANPSIATVVGIGANATVRGVAAGTTIITVTAAAPAAAGFAAASLERQVAITVTGGGGGGAGLGRGFGAEQFSRIEAGSFDMGSTNGSSDERPVRRVTVSRAFLLQKTEVTQVQWRQVMQGTPLENPSWFPTCGETCPVENVSWNDVQLFLTRLNQQDPGKSYRLPTEAEWEYAARAGTTGDYGISGPVCSFAWMVDDNCSQLQTWPVALKPTNAWLLHDMHGNVGEWVNDWYSETFYGTGSTTDPLGPTTGTLRVVRGGAFSANAPWVRSAVRGATPPVDRVPSIGFRLVRSP